MGLQTLRRLNTRSVSGKTLTNTNTHTLRQFMALTVPDNYVEVKRNYRNLKDRRTLTPPKGEFFKLIKTAK